MPPRAAEGKVQTVRCVSSLHQSEETPGSQIANCPLPVYMGSRMYTCSVRGKSDPDDQREDGRLDVLIYPPVPKMPQMVQVKEMATQTEAGFEVEA